MNITFFIGNGFDVAIGLSTRYIDFLKEYVESDSSSQVISDFKHAIKNDLKNESHNWSDLELEFGNYTKHLSSEEEIVTIYNDCRLAICEYIKLESQKIDFEQCKNEIVQTFEAYLKGFYNELKYVPKDHFVQTSRINTIPESITIGFVSFNYTNCLELCIKHLKTVKPHVSSHIVRDSSYPTTIGKLNYIHGTISDFNPIFGVNDESQIKFEKELSVKTKRKIIKPFKNDAVGGNVNYTIKKIIKATNVYCIFGMSIGDTDKCWWNEIGNALKANNTAQVIYYVFNSAIKFDSFTAEDEKLDIEETFKNFLMDQLCFSDEERNNLAKNIHIIVNSTIFQMNLVQLTNKKRSSDSYSTEGHEDIVDTK